MSSSGSDSWVIEARGIPPMWLWFIAGGSSSNPAQRRIRDSLYNNGYAALSAASAPTWIAGSWSGLFIHTPWGHPEAPFEFEGDAGLICRDSGDPKLAALFNGFAAAWSPYVARLPIVGYVGNFFRATQPTNWPGMSDAAWAARRDQAIAPIISIGGTLGMDVASLTPAGGRDLAWYKTLQRSPILEAFWQPGFEHLGQFPRVITQTFFDNPSSHPIGPDRGGSIIGLVDIPGGQVPFDYMCKWAYRAIHVDGYVPLLNADVIGSATRAQVYARGALLWQQSPTLP